MNIIRTILFLCLATLMACSDLKKSKNGNGDCEQITINPNKASKHENLSLIADSVKFIKLQTNPDCILGQVPMLFMGEKYIYALESQQGEVVVFDMKGKYVGKLSKHGKGPEEYSDFTGVFFDRNDRYIEIADYKRIIKYTVPNFSFVEERKLPDEIVGVSTRKFEDTYYFATQNVDNYINGEVTNAGLIAAKDNIIKPLFEKKINSNGYFNIAFSESFTVNDKNELFASLKFDNTFYRLHNMEATPVMTVDFGRYGLDNTIGDKPGNEPIKIIDKLSDVAYHPVLNINNSNLLAISYFYSKSNGQKTSHFYFRLNNTGDIIHTQNLKNDLTDFPKFVDIRNGSNNISHESWYKDYLISIVLPYEVVTEKTMSVEGLGTINQEDNPIIMLLKLKK